MTGSTWARAKELLAEAAEYPPADRERYILEHCTDPELQREVIALLATPAPLSDIVAAKALQLQPGARLGAYVVEGQIGSGGMGDVYRARDSRLGRNVAVKVLPPLFAEDRERLARFEREARLLASLNHPNICTLFDVGRERETSFIAMELLEGHTLREHIGGKPLRLPQLLEIGVQIVDALAAMHQNGIVHRDIKPSNIFVTDHGQAKLLDVGLAKASALTTADSIVPTVTEQELTNAGMALGTVAYMSPEQARGEELDSRSDLFSFGAVLYEMATGRPPFTGNTAATIFNAVLNTTPTSPGRLNPALPSELERIIAKLLEKERELRYQTAAELRVDLKRIRRETDSRAAAPAAPFTPGLPRWSRYALPLALLIAVVAVARFLGLLHTTPSRQTSTQWIQLTNFDDSAVSPALSADGSMVAFIRGPLPYVTRGQIYVKLLPDGEARQLTHD
jgi:serine/threonine protein kinase